MILLRIKKGFLTSLWFVFLTFPIIVIKVDPIERTVGWRWHNALYMAVGTFCVYLLVKYIQIEKKTRPVTVTAGSDQFTNTQILQYPYETLILVLVLSFALPFPHFFSPIKPT